MGEEAVSGVVVDTDVVIWALRGSHEFVQALNELRSRAPVLISTATIAELYAGVKPREIPSLEEMLRIVGRLRMDDDIARRAGGYLRQFERSHGLDLADALIAASCVAAEAPLWTLNRKHYPMSEIRFLDPLAERLPSG